MAVCQHDTTAAQLFGTTDQGPAIVNQQMNYKIIKINK